jgi:cytochrome b561
VPAHGILRTTLLLSIGTVRIVSKPRRHSPSVDTKSYNHLAILLHWLTACLIVANWLLGLSMVPLPISPRKLSWYLVHKSIGLTVLLLTSLRLGARLVGTHPSPVPMPAWQRRATLVAHALLYALLFAIPLTGWLYSSATGVQVVYLGLLPLPDLVPRDRALGDVLRLVHVGLNVTLALVVLVHLSAAIRHHVVDRDVTLVRMLPLLRLASRHPDVRAGTVQR